MNLAMRLASGVVLSAALISVPASAGSYRGHHGHHGDYERHSSGKIGTLGGILLGAAVLGTIAAVATEGRRNRYGRSYEAQPYGGYTGYRGYDDDYARNDPRPVPQSGYTLGDGDAYADEPNGYDRQAATSDPVEECSRAAERQAQNGGGLARVVGIDRVDDIAGGASVHGRLEVEAGQSAPARNLRFRCYASGGAVLSLRLS